jgi:hypothetical protein
MSRTWGDSPEPKGLAWGFLVLYIVGVIAYVWGWIEASGTQ